MVIEKLNLSEQDYLLAEVVVKVAAMERLFVKAGIFTNDDLQAEMKQVSQEIIAYMANKSMISKTEDIKN